MGSYLQSYLDWLRAFAGAIRPDRDDVRAAAALAAAFTTGAAERLWVADVADTGFGREISNRAGGLAALQPIPEDVGRLTEADVVIAADAGLEVDAQIALYRQIQQQGACLVFVGPEDSAVLEQITPDFGIDNGLGRAPNYLVGGQYCPLDTTVNVTVTWCLIAEFVNECVARGRMPVVNESIFRPNGAARAGLYAADGFFHAPGEFDVVPVPPGVDSTIFTGSLLGSVERLIATQTPLLEAATRWYADVIAAGGTLWMGMESHIVQHQFCGPGNPGMFTYLDTSTVNDTNFRELFSERDVFTYIGYYDYPRTLIYFMNRATGNSVWLQGGAAATPIDMSSRRIVVDQMWEFGDAVVNLPGYDIRAIPPSGVIQTCLLWDLIDRLQTRLENGASA